MKGLRDQNGQAVVLVVLCMTGLLGLVGVAVDVGTLFRAKRVIQTAADSGAIAGALELNYGDVTAAAQAAAAQNGVTNGSGGATVTVNSPPLHGPHNGVAGYVEVIASQSQPTFFMQVFNRSSVTVNARAVASLGSAHNCITTLGASGTDILLNGAVSLTAQNCSIIDDSSSSQALLLNGSNTLTAQSIGIVGNVLKNGSNTITPTPVTGIVPDANPLAFLPAPSFNASSCLANPNINGGGTYTVGPSTSGGTVCYNGLTINGTPTVTFNPGIYIFNGAFIVNGAATITGTGVTFYFPNSSASFTDNGTTTLNLTAPTSGTYNGILFFQDPSDSQQMTINGASNSVLKGILYFPSANLILNGSSSETLYVSLITSSLTFNGTGTLQDYAVINGSTPLTAAKLVE